MLILIRMLRLIPIPIVTMMLMLRNILIHIYAHMHTHTLLHVLMIIRILILTLLLIRVRIRIRIQVNINTINIIIRIIFTIRRTSCSLGWRIARSRPGQDRTSTWDRPAPAADQQPAVPLPPAATRRLVTALSRTTTWDRPAPQAAPVQYMGATLGPAGGEEGADLRGSKPMRSSTGATSEQTSSDTAEAVGNP